MKEQMEDAAFWRIDGERGWYHKAVDEHAIYGNVTLGERDPEETDLPIRSSPRDLVTAIRTVQPGDRIRVNDKGPMTAVRVKGGSMGEGFVCKYDAGSTLYAIDPSNPSNRPAGTFDLPWMRRWNGYMSHGEVCCLEVEWRGEQYE